MTNRELIEQAVSLGQKLGKPVRTFGLSRGALLELVEDLHKQVAANELGNAATQAQAPVVPAASEAAPPPAAPVPEPEPEPVRPIDGATGELAAEPVVMETPAPPSAPAGGYEVAPGKAISSLRGILGPGTRVVPKDFMHGEETITHLVSRGHLVPSKGQP